MKNLFWILTFSLLLTSCASSTSNKENFQSIESLSEDKIRIYFIREYKWDGLIGMAGAGSVYPLMIDGTSKYEISNSSYFYVDLEPGEHEIVSESDLETLPGKFILNINGEAGDSFYIKIEYRLAEMEEASFKGGVVGGILGSAIGMPGEILGSTMGSIEAKRSESEQNNGPFRLILLPEEDAIKLMQKLKYEHPQTS